MGFEDDGGDADEVWSDFGQKVDLTARLREILLNYPEGTSILKELVQNADDAGARTVRVCLDERQHGTSSLAYEKLAPFQGPALLVFNNSTFREADFESISRIGDSVKREQVGKTGRFGVGFNSVYHLTDMPSFVSGRHIVFFDPHCKFLPNVSAANPGKRIDFVTNDILTQHTDQFSPFAAFGCDMRSHFEGTTFRFPLRTAEQAATSRLSKASYTPAGVRELLEAFAGEKVLDLLYLKNVERIEVLKWGAGEAAPRVIATSETNAAGAQELRTHRAAFSRASAALAAGSAIEAPSTFTLEFKSSGVGAGALSAAAAGGAAAGAGAGAGAGVAESVRTFIVSQALGTDLMPLVTAAGLYKSNAVAP